MEEESKKCSKSHKGSTYKLTKQTATTSEPAPQIEKEEEEGKENHNQQQQGLQPQEEIRSSSSSPTKRRSSAATQTQFTSSETQKDMEHVIDNMDGSSSSLSSSSSSSSSDDGDDDDVWKICGREYSRDCVTYMMRCIMLYILAIASLVNLTVGVPPHELWISSLAVSMGGMGIVMFNGAISGSKSRSNSSVFH